MNNKEAASREGRWAGGAPTALGTSSLWLWFAAHILDGGGVRWEENKQGTCFSSSAGWIRQRTQSQLASGKEHIITALICLSLRAHSELVVQYYHPCFLFIYFSFSFFSFYNRL